MSTAAAIAMACVIGTLIALALLRGGSRRDD